MPNTKSGSTSAVAIVLPTIFAVILIILIGVSVILLPKFQKVAATSTNDETVRRRMASLENECKKECFGEWCGRHGEKAEYLYAGGNGSESESERPLCTICLETIEDSANIRGLGCLHVFHQQCLDDWFARWNEFCPLCHRPILPLVSAAAVEKRGAAAAAAPKRVSSDTTDYSVAEAV